MYAGQLPRCIPRSHQVSGPSGNRVGIQLWNGRCPKCVLHPIYCVDPLTCVALATFAMVSACLIRRKQLMARGLPDPFAKTGVTGGDSSISTVRLTRYAL